MVRHVPPGKRVVLGLSGGIDSVVLLHALLAYQAAHALQLACVHIHHGLSPHADAWTDFCRQLCAQHNIPLSVHHVTVDRRDPAGLEAAARSQRSAVFARIESDFVVTAHHQNDQAETLLLQLLRGAGPKGLAAMPELQHYAAWQAAQLRPLLNIPRADIVAYARQYALAWIEDESNAHTVHTRNYLRHTLMPLVLARFPGALATLGRGAALQAEASILLDELAAIDALDCVVGDRLDCQRLARLSVPRARNVLRWFIARQGLRMPHARRLDETLRQLIHAADDARVSVKLNPGTELRRYCGGAYLVTPRDCAQQVAVPWHGEGSVRLAQAGWDLTLTPTPGRGLSLAKLAAAKVTVGVRQGGEKIRLVKTGRQRSLKNLLQESHLPPWQRDCLPLMWCDGKLVWAADIGIDANYQAAADEPGIVPTKRFLADASLDALCDV